MFHGWMFYPDGHQAAADSTRSSSCLDTGSSVNPRTDRGLVTASYTSIIHRLLAASHRHAGLVNQDLSTTFPAMTWARSLYSRCCLSVQNSRASPWDRQIGCRLRLQTSRKDQRGSTPPNFPPEWSNHLR